MEIEQSIVVESTTLLPNTKMGIEPFYGIR